MLRSFLLPGKPLPILEQSPSLLLLLPSYHLPKLSRETMYGAVTRCGKPRLLAPFNHLAKWLLYCPFH